MKKKLFAQFFIIIALVGSSPQGSFSANPPHMHFEHITVADGLPGSSVRAIVQDALGFLWFGTHAGLVRFDGYEMKVFLPDPNDSNSIAGRIITELMIDSEDNLWIGTLSSGVSRYNIQTGQFRNWEPSPSNQPGSVPGRNVSSIFQDPDGSILVGFLDSGTIARIEPATGQVSTIAHPAGYFINNTKTLFMDKEGHLWGSSSDEGVVVRQMNGVVVNTIGPEQGYPNLKIRKILADQLGNVWLLGHENLLCFNLHSKLLTVLRPPEADLPQQPLLMVDMIQDPDGDFWIAANLGIFHFQTNDGSFKLFSHDSNRSDSLANGPCLTVFIDNSGIFWVGTWHAGLDKYNPGANKFNFISKAQSRDRPILSLDSISSITSDNNHRLWVGTGSLSNLGQHGGLQYLDDKTGTFVQVAFPDSTVRVVDNIASTNCDSLWLGTNSGVWLYRASDGMIRRPTIDSPHGPTLTQNSIRASYVDSRGHVWFCNHLAGLFDFDPAVGSATLYSHVPNDAGSLSQNTVQTILEDSSGRMWFGTDRMGLNLFNPETQDFEKFFNPKLGLIGVSDLIESADGHLWLGGLAGLLEFDPDRKKVIRSIGRSQGLPNDFVRSILEDENGHLWLSTGKGLVDFNPSNGKIRVFDQHDGLPGDAPFLTSYRANDGTMYFGGRNGLVFFHPQLVQKQNTYSPPVVLTELRLFDQPLDPGPQSPLLSNLPQTRQISFPWNQNHLTFKFSSLDFSRPERNLYRYQMENHDQQWSQPSSNRQAVYTRLSPGHYRFRVQATNGEGVWSENEAQIEIVINAPWWATPIAKLIYALLGISILFLVFMISTLRIKRAADLKIRLVEFRQLQELDQIKSRFYANITHEFRTPLTLIQGPLGLLEKDPAKGSKELFTLMGRNSRRLGQLIDQLLDLSRLESHGIRVNWQPIDLWANLRVLSASFHSLSEIKGLQYETLIPPERCLCLADPDLLEKVVSNLLTNAIKYSPLGARVWLHVELGSESSIDKSGSSMWPQDAHVQRQLLLRVGNTGSFIPNEKHDKIFDRFYQMSGAASDSRGGSGIGLALIRELIDLLGGKVTVVSDKENGTVFTVELPIFPTRIQLPLDPPASLDKNLTLFGSIPSDEPVHNRGDESFSPNHPLLLLVEDDPDLRLFLYGILKNDYRIVLAKDGEDGIDAAFSEIPDLIISDIMMPGKDGFELCAAVKKNESTNHIPVVLLTARTESQSRIKGLKIGADSYLGKPFDPEELLAQVQNLIQQRIMLREHLVRSVRAGFIIQPEGDESIVSTDTVFLERITGIAAENIQDTEFSVAHLCREVGMSRSQLHRKLTALTGLSASAFLRSVRLHKAAELLGNNCGNVTEVAFATGHKSLSHFSRTFKEEFGMVPSDYK